jgi:RNA polymerase sigma factor (sigma-70 family)
MEALDYEANLGLVHFHAKRGFAWAQAAGVSLTYEDMFQEASLAFVNAARGFNPDAGVQFSAYFSRAAHTQFVKAVGRFTGVKRLNDDMKAEIAEREAENARRRAQAQKELPSVNYSLAVTSFEDMGRGYDDEEAPSFVDALDSGVQSPEEIVETRQLMERALADLSPLAALILDWLRDPPDELVAELESQRAHALIAEEAGVRTRAMKDGLSLANVKKFLLLTGEVTERELIMADAELRRAVAQIERAA